MWRERKQKKGRGYSILSSHIVVEHPQWQAEFASLSKQSTIDSATVSRSGGNLHGWLEMIIMSHQPFSFCENEIIRKNCVNLQPISVDTLTKYVDLVVEEVEKGIANSLPDNFAIICDGWTANSVHYFTVFASCFDHASKSVCSPLLAIAPLQDEEKLDAASHAEFISATLTLFGKSLAAISALVADNEPLNRALSRLLKSPMIGCASHRLNLAVVRYLSESEIILEKISTFMIKRRTLKRSANLRKQTQLRPVLRDKTRWSSTFEMISRYEKLKNFIPRDDLELMPYILDETEEAAVTSLHARLTEIDTVTKMLQQERGVSVSVIRALFDGENYSWKSVI